MNNPTSPLHQQTRRHFFSECGVGLGKMALASLCVEGAYASEGHHSGLPHHKPKAKHVIHLFMSGAPSQLELFDYKPGLARIEGQPLPPSLLENQRYAFIRKDAAVMSAQFRFAKHGKCGMEISDALPHLSKVVDDITLVRSLKTDQFNHAPAQIFFNTGSGLPGRPSIGSWVTYGLGSENKNLPGFMVFSTGAGISGGAANWSSGFLPTPHAGVRLRNQGEAMLNLSRPADVSNAEDRATAAALRAINAQRQRTELDPTIDARISSYELAYRMQTEAPDVMDLSRESKETLELYGADPKVPSFARACLLARRMIERGVRFINIYHEGWDAHSDVVGNINGNAKATDKASAALIIDLKQRGLLDDTIVIWGGEFGRTPMVESNKALGRSQGRDHHPAAYSMWFAGGGFKKGFTYGETDDLGFNVVKDPVHVHDIQATLLHCLGIDHKRLTYRFAGRDYRLTDVHGQVVPALLA
ncbi:MAG: DUF1501 domain-containing protein [Armatimonadota bacterium]